MADSIITKKAISDSFKKILKEKPFEKISGKCFTATIPQTFFGTTIKPEIIKQLKIIQK